MHKDRAPTDAKRVGPLMYQLPEEAHIALLQMRDHLHLLARLTEPRMADEDDELPLSHAALARYFTRLAMDIERVADAAQWPRGDRKQR